MGKQERDRLFGLVAQVEDGRDYDGRAQAAIALALVEVADAVRELAAAQPDECTERLIRAADKYAHGHAAREALIDVAAALEKKRHIDRTPPISDPEIAEPDYPRAHTWESISPVAASPVVDRAELSWGAYHDTVRCSVCRYSFDAAATTPCPGSPPAVGDPYPGQSKPGV